ncbi:MAG: hypothetical protein KDI30_02825 [Pseudomonadales bacterium]|nr:hypothetical protein [Pseudomonadales bacterium]
MKISELFFSAVCLLALLRSIFIHPLEQFMGVAIASILLGSLFFYSKFWAEHILGLGFWESKASDFKTAKNSWLALRFLAIFSMMMLCYMLYFKQ